MSKVKMRPVTTSKMQSMRRSYNRAIDGDEIPDQTSGNPYQSMYNQAFGAGSEKKERNDLYGNMMLVTPSKKRMSIQQYHKSATR